jgi:MFS family permease
VLPRRPSRLPLSRLRPQLVVLALAATAMLASGPGQSFLIAVFVDELIAAADVTRTGFSLLYAGGTVVSAASMLMIGRLADRSGLRAVWAVAALGLAGACLLASLVHGIVLAFLALAFLRTFGQGTFPLAATLLVARSFRGRRGQAFASASLGLTVASIALPPASVGLILAFGWRDAYRLLGLAVLVLVLPLGLLIRDGGRRATEPAPAGATGGRYPRALRVARRGPAIALPTRRARRLLFVVSAPPFLMTAVIFHAVAVLDERGLSLAQAGGVLALLGAANAAGTIAGGAVADRVRTRSLLVAMTALLLLGIALLLFRSTPAAVAAYLAIGLGGGVFGVTSGIVWPRTYGLAGLGRLQGTATSVQIAGAAAGPLPLALASGLTGGFDAGLLALGLYAAVVLVVAFRWRDPRIVRLRPR